MQGFVGTAISEHLAHLADGSLLCRGVNIARTGIQLYRPEELAEWGEAPELPRGALVPVLRLPEEIFSRKSMSSAEGVPLVSPHPGVFLSPSNWKAYASGHIQNVREGDALPNGDRTLVADLIVRDRETAEQIELRRRRQVSMGYSCRYEMAADGNTWLQRDIVYNHCAIVEKARGGNSLAVMDAEPSGLRELEVLEKFSRVMDRASVLYPDIVEDFMRDLGGIFPQPMLTEDAAASDAEEYAQQCRAFHRSARCR
jgi:hypothetical protein